jgi:hypothetical protein
LSRLEIQLVGYAENTKRSKKVTGSPRDDKGESEAEGSAAYLSP